MYQRPEMGAIFMQKNGERRSEYGFLDAGNCSNHSALLFGRRLVQGFEKINDKYIPEICGTAGVILGIVGLFVMPDFPAQDVITAAAVGAVSGLAAVGVNQCVKQSKK